MPARSIIARQPGSYLAEPLGSLDAHALDNGGVKIGISEAPSQRWQMLMLDPADIEQRRLARVVPVLPLLDATRPAALIVGDDPAAGAVRHVQPEVRPGMASPRMLKDTAPVANRFESCLETAAVITLCLSMPCSFDMYGGTCP